MNKLFAVSATLALACASFTAIAGDGFVRAELGKGNVKAKVVDLGSESDSDTAYSLRGGYWFNQNFAVEAHYSRFYDKTLYDDGSDHVDGELSAIGLGIVAKEHWTPANEGFFVQLRGGIARGKISIDSNLGSGSETSTKPYVGIGVGYDFNPKFGLSLNYDHNQGGSDNDVKITANTLSLGLEARF